MANQNTPNSYQSRDKKLLLGKLYTDASVRVEPEEPQKVLVAGLAEKRNIKEYPDTFFGRAYKIFGGEFGKTLKHTLFFILFTIPFVVFIAWFSGYFENLVLGGTYNFVSEIGIGFPGGGDSLQESIARLYWDVKEPVMLMIGATFIFGSVGLAGSYYINKRNYYQNYYSKAKTFWMGVAKYWWVFLICGLIGTLIVMGMGTSLIYLLQQQTLSTAGAGAYCGVVFSWIFGLPLLLFPLILPVLYISYELTFWQAVKNTLVVIVNNPISVVITAVLSAVPIVLMSVSGMILAIIIYAVMIFAGCNLYELAHMALINRSMTKCHNRFAEEKRMLEIEQRRQARKNSKNGASAYVGAGGNAQKKTKQQPKPYKGQKKKKKKR